MSLGVTLTAPWSSTVHCYFNSKYSQSYYV
jgi:hypothetical protein